MGRPCSSRHTSTRPRAEERKSRTLPQKVCFGHLEETFAKSIRYPRCNRVDVSFCPIWASLEECILDGLEKFPRELVSVIAQHTEPRY